MGRTIRGSGSRTRRKQTAKAADARRRRKAKFGEADEAVGPPAQITEETEPAGSVPSVSGENDMVDRTILEASPPQVQQDELEILPRTIPLFEDYVVIDLIDDNPFGGNCLFISISLSIFGDGSQHLKARTEMIDFYSMVDKDDKIREQLTNAYLDGFTPAGWVKYHRLEENGAWASQNEIYAAATMLQAPVYMFRPKEISEEVEMLTFHPWFTTDPKWKINDPSLTGKMIVIRCTGSRGDHFQPMVLRNLAAGVVDRLQMKEQLSQRSREMTPSVHEKMTPPPRLKKKDELVTPVKPKTPRKQGITPDRYIAAKGNMMRLLSDNESLKAKLKVQRNLIKNLDSATDHPVTAQLYHELNAATRQVRSLKKQLAVKDVLVRDFRNCVAQGKIVKRTKNVVTWVNDTSNPTKARIRPLFSKAKGRHFVHVPVSNVPFAYANRNLRRSRIITLDGIVEALAGGEHATPFQKSELLIGCLQRDRATLAALKANKIVSSMNSKLTPEETAQILNQANLTGRQAAKIRKLLFKFDKQIFASEHEIRHLFKSRELKAEMEMVNVNYTKLKKGPGGKEMETEVKLQIHRASSLVDFVKETWEKTMAISKLVDSDHFENCIWMAIGGDKGGGTTKIVISFLNTENPASVTNQHILAISNGSDDGDDLRHMLNKYANEWVQLEELQLPYKQRDDGYWEMRALKIFLFGDLMFQHGFAGLRGPSAEYPCIQCLIPLHKLRNPGPQAFKDTYQKRTIEQHEVAVQFLHENAKRREKQKYMHSVARSPIFPIPFEQYAPPVLHMYLGNGTLLLNKIEGLAKQIDLKKHGEAVEKITEEYQKLCREVEQLQEAYLRSIVLADEQSRIFGMAINASTKKKDPSNPCQASLCFCFNNDFSSSPNLVDCKTCKKKYHMECCLILDKEDQEEIRLIGEFICPACVGLPSDSETSLQALQDVSVAAVEAQSELRTDLAVAVQNRDAIRDAPVNVIPEAIMQYEKSLQELGIDKQAFQGGTFVGNHIKKAIDGDGPRNITKCLETMPEARNEYIKKLTELNKVRMLMNRARFLSSVEIDDFCKSCDEMGRLSDEYRKDDETVTNKWHVTVVHAKEFARRWRTVGLINESGIEAMHQYMNKLFIRYAPIRGLGRKLVLAVKEHERRLEGTKG